jgi:hypothetical protein
MTAQGTTDSPIVPGRKFLIEGEPSSGRGDLVNLSMLESLEAWLDNVDAPKDHVFRWAAKNLRDIYNILEASYSPVLPHEESTGSSKGTEK